MNAAALAEHLRARPTGTCRWRAICPAHADRTPSLSIREGNDGRVLIHCWAGCATDAVLAAAGLTWADIFGAPTTQAYRARLRREREQREAAAAAEHKQRLAHMALLRSADAALDRFAEQLARVLWAGAPGDADDLAAQYHRLLRATWEREAQAAL